MEETLNNKKFAEGFCFIKMFLIFIIGCVFGAYYEELLTFFTKVINHDPLIWESRRGLIYGPFSPVYGLGAYLMAYFLARKTRPIWKTFVYTSLAGGFVEYLISFLQETFVGTVSWDYSNYFLNINGRTTIPYMLFWGLLGVVFVKWIYPFLSNAIEKIPIKIGTIISTILITFICLDMLISFSALFRQTFRHRGYEPLTPIGRLYDKIYNDEYLSKIYNNMREKKE